VAQRKLAFWTYWAFAVKIFLSHSPEASKLDIGGMTKRENVLPAGSAKSRYRCRLDVCSTLLMLLLVR
jgi:hypothetical protein